MPPATRICKICGKEYPYCQTITNDKFRWQDVACSPKHATEYFELIKQSRKKAKTGVQAPVTEEKDEIVDTSAVIKEADVVANVDEKVDLLRPFSSLKRRKH